MAPRSATAEAPVPISVRPEISVALVVPLRNEEASVDALVASILAQTRSPDEVVFVDAGSTDRTAALLARHCAGRPAWRVLEVGPAFPGVARNAGAEATDKEFVAFADAGTELEPEWLDELCNAAKEDRETDLVFGNYEPVVDTRFKEWAALAYVPAPTRRAHGRVRGPSIASSLVRRSLWKSVGGFPPFRAAEDLAFMERASRLARRVEHTPHATIHWQMADGWAATFRRTANYSRHNLIAGRGRDWHRGVIRNWILLVACLALAIWLSPWWGAAGLAGGWARVAVTAWRKRGAFGFGSPFHPVRLLGILAVLLLLDLATFWGVALWLRRDIVGRGRPA